MKTLRKIRKDAKALSPVVASIILIAVTVAVSIAVAAWMGALSIGFMDTEQLTITNCQFIDANTIQLTVTNTGTKDVQISSATVNGVTAPVTGAPVTAAANTPGVTVNVEYTWTSAFSYNLRLLSSKGNYFPYNVVAP